MQSERKEKTAKKKEKATPFGANLLRSQLLYRAAQGLRGIKAVCSTVASSMDHKQTCCCSFCRFQSLQSMWNCVLGGVLSWDPPCLLTAVRGPNLGPLNICLSSSLHACCTSDSVS